MQYDDLPGAATTNIEARIRSCTRTASTRSWRSPTRCWRFSTIPDKKLRELAFRIYNEYIAELQERSDGHFYGAGLINWWDPKGTQRTLAELKSLGLKTFLMPLNPGKDDDGNSIDYCEHRDERRSGTRSRRPGCRSRTTSAKPRRRAHASSTASSVGMMINIDGFRETFSKYIFGGILDRHPALRIGWFEGGIAWVPWALQDAEHLVASYQHMFNRPLEHDIRYYWDTHMSASFMVDPLGLKLIDQIGVDKVMWSSDYPHNESTFGYSEKSLAAVVDAVGPDERRAASSAATSRSSWASVTMIRAPGPRPCGASSIPEEPDLARMRRETGARLAVGDGRPRRRRADPAGEQQRGVRHRRELAGVDAGLSYVERPVAVVLADDE